MKTLTLSFLMLLGISLPLRADSLQEDLMHIMAHGGGTYMMTHGTEVVCKHIIGKDKKLTCTIAGMVLANSVNVAYKASQGFPNDTKRAVTAGALGSGAAALMIAIDF